MIELTYGVGFNSRGKHKTRVAGKQTIAYQTWHSMLTRCYDPRYHKKQPTYIDCAVTPVWHDFQKFAEWFENNSFKGMGYHLDKDVLSKGNKIYSPENCCLVPLALNILLVDSGAARGKYPQGVSFDKSRGKYYSQMKINGRSKNLGRFDCPDEAYQTYKAAKEAYVKEKALEWQDRIADNVFQALMNWTLDS